jgi:hypothetical protein
MNENTPLIDLSQVYASDPTTANRLRAGPFLASSQIRGAVVGKFFVNIFIQHLFSSLHKPARILLPAMTERIFLLGNLFQVLYNLGCLA